jgi:hypothetical protein
MPMRVVDLYCTMALRHCFVPYQRWGTTVRVVGRDGGLERAQLLRGDNFSKAGE